MILPWRYALVTLDLHYSIIQVGFWYTSFCKYFGQKYYIFRNIPYCNRKKAYFQNPKYLWKSGRKLSVFAQLLFIQTHLTAFNTVLNVLNHKLNYLFLNIYILQAQKHTLTDQLSKVRLILAAMSLYASLYLYFYPAFSLSMIKWSMK